MAITRTHFAYRIDLWTDDEKEVVEHLADVDDLTVALATYLCRHRTLAWQGNHPTPGPACDRR